MLKQKEPEVSSQQIKIHLKRGSVLGIQEFPYLYLNKVYIHALGNVSLHVHYYFDDDRMIDLPCHLAKVYIIRLYYLYQITVDLFTYYSSFLFSVVVEVCTDYILPICQQCTNHHNSLSLLRLLLFYILILEHCSLYDYYGNY